MITGTNWRTGVTQSQRLGHQAQHHMSGALQWLKRSSNSAASQPIAVSCDEALPLYAQTSNAKISRSGQTLVVSVDDEKVATARLLDASQVVLLGWEHFVSAYSGRLHCHRSDQQRRDLTQ